MAVFPAPRLPVLVLCLVTGLAAVASPAVVGVAAAPAPSAGPHTALATPPSAGARPASAAGPGSTTSGPELRRAGPSPPAQADRFAWPLAPPHPVVRPFDAPASPYGPGHRGVDLGGPAGAPVLSAGAGVVVFAGQLAGRGVVSVDHPNGLRTTYEPLAPAVKAGQKVAAATVLGRLRPGHAGCPGACLHWGVRRGKEYLDPLAFVAAGHVRLKPWKEVR
jgi:murein DD-endopeptidase MepM/ murein hydrolase activator NlpD